MLFRSCCFGKGYLERSCRSAFDSGFNLLTSVSLLGCYGVPPAKASEDWMCSRCSANALEEVSASMLSLSPRETRLLRATVFHVDSAPAV